MNSPLLRHLASALVVLATFPCIAGAQQDLHEFEGNARGNQFGRVLAPAGDVNLDGYDDLAVGMPYENTTTGIDVGRVRIYSGKDGSILRTLTGLQPGDQFGFSVATIGDPDGDGVADFIAGAPFSDANGTSSGQVRIFSGADGSTISTIDGVHAGDRFGFSVANAGSYDKAWHVVVGAPYAELAGVNRGSVTLATTSGFTAQTFYGTEDDEHFGWSVAAANDLSGDNYFDIVGGAPDYDGAGSGKGRVRILSGDFSHAILQTLIGAADDDHFGTAVAMTGDVNGDGKNDFIVGAPGAFAGNGQATVYSGGTFATLYTKTGNSTGDEFGASVARAGDTNNDGRPDFIVGAPGDGSNGPSGSAVLYSGANGSLLKTFLSTGVGGQLGFAVSGAGDANNDGRADVAIGAPFATIDGAEAGSVSLYSGNGFGVLETIDGAVTGDAMGTAVASLDVDGDGFSDILVGSPGDDHFVILNWLEETGSVRAYSGKNGTSLWTIYGGGEGDELGFSLASLGQDVDSDGVVDFVVGAPERKNGGHGYARICSGATGATLFTATGGVNDFEFGYAVANGGRLTSDFINDAVIGSPGYDFDRGRVAFVNSVTGAVTNNTSAFGTAAGERFGSAVCSLGDQNGDGFADLLVGAPSNDETASGAGRVYAIRGGATAGILFTLSGASSGEAMGTSVASVNSWDGDAKREFVVGIPGFDKLGGSNCGAVRAYFASTQNTIWTVTGTGADDRLGTSLANLGDFNLDGFDELASGASESGLTAGQGYVKVISGYQGLQLYTFDGESAGDGFGRAVAAGGDIDADGSLDLLVGVPNDDPSGISSGSAKAISLAPQGVSDFGTGSAGCTGLLELRANSPAKIGSSVFTLSSNHVPAGNALGLLLIANAQDVAGSDPFGLGVKFHVNLFASTFLQGYDMTSTQFPNGFAKLPIPNSAPLVGVTLYAQSLWVNACPLPPFNLSSSEGLAFTFQN